MNIWIEKTITKGRPERESGDRAVGKSLWSPRADKRGGDIYKNMRLVKSGDIIIHLLDNKYISGVSLVEESVVDTKKTLGNKWDGDQYFIKLKGYIVLDKPIARDLILNDKNEKILTEISSDSEVFYTYSLNLRQGAYLTPCPPKLAILINNTYKEQNSMDLPYFDKLK